MVDVEGVALVEGNHNSSRGMDMEMGNCDCPSMHKGKLNFSYQANTTIEKKVALGTISQQRTKIQENKSCHSAMDHLIKSICTRNERFTKWKVIQHIYTK